MVLREKDNFSVVIKSYIDNYKSYDLPLVKSSDAHFLSDIGKGSTRFLLSAPLFSEVGKAFQSIEGRAVNL